MDPSIMKLLEDDEDETAHSGADVEAFTAALNRDIEGDISTSQPSGSDSATISQRTDHSSNQLLSQWQTSSHEENTNYQGQQALTDSQQLQHSTEMKPKQHGSSSESRKQLGSLQEQSCLTLQPKQFQDDSLLQQGDQDTVPISQAMGVQDSEKKPVNICESGTSDNLDSESQYLKLQKVGTHQSMATVPAINQTNRSKQVPFALLLPVIQPQLDKDRAMQLNTLYLKLKKNEISKDEFVRHMRSLVGDQMLKMAVYKLQAQAARTSQNGPNRFPLQSQASAQQFADSHPFPQLHQKGLSSPADSAHVSSSTPQMQTDSITSAINNNAQKSDSQGIQVNQMPYSNSNVANQERDCSFPIQGLSKQQQQHFHFSQTSFPSYGNTGNNYHQYSGANVNNSVPSVKHQPYDSQMRQLPVSGATATSQTMNLPKFDRQNSINESKRVQSGPLSHLTNNSSIQQNTVPWQSSINKEQKNGAGSMMSHVKQEPTDQVNEQPQKSQLSTSQGLPSFSTLQIEQGNAIPGPSKDEPFDVPSARTGFSLPPSVIPSNSSSSAMTTQMESSVSIGSRVPPTTSPIAPGSITKTPPKKSSVGLKKPLEALGSSPPMSSKKQKLSGAFLDQSIEQLNDVTAVSGVNLREEEEQLFSGSKEDSRASEASRRVVQEEEERLLLQKFPLQRKLAEIIAKCGLKNMSNDVERCLSLCVEERMRGLISNLVRLSKQRVDIEKSRHRTLVTSDVRQHIMVMNRKAREEWEKKQAEADKLQKQNEPEDGTGDVDKEKDDGRSKSVKVNKEEDDKMRTTAANVAARAAVGGDDMLSKWQLMAEQARQKREGGGMDVASSSQPIKEGPRKTTSASAKSAINNQEADIPGHTAAINVPGAVRKFGRSQVVPQTRTSTNISVKDVIAVLEREPQMSKSTLIYRLYEKMRANAAVVD